MVRSKAAWEANRRRMAELVEGWRTSGESAAGFARRHGITVSRFQYWRDRIKGKRCGRVAADPAVTFAPVEVVGTPSSHDLEIVLAGGTMLRAGRDVRVEVLRTAIDALCERC